MKQPIIIALCAAGVAGIYLFEATLIRTVSIGDPVGPRLYPIILGVGMLVAALVLLVETYTARRKAGPTEISAPMMVVPRVTALTILWTFLYFFCFEYLGFVIATILYLLPLFFVFNGKKIVPNVATAILVPVSLYFVFTRFLEVPLGAGLLPF